MTRKVFSVCFLVSSFFSNTLLASTDGLYFGGGLTYLNAQSNITVANSANVIIALLIRNDILVGIADQNIASQTTKLPITSSNGFGINALAGYSWPIASNFSLALQADANIVGNQDSKFSQHVVSNAIEIRDQPVNLSYSVSEENQGSIGFSFLPIWHIKQLPYQIENWQSSLFFKFGYRYGAFKSELNASNQFFQSGDFTSNDWRHGVEYGLGGQVALNKQLDLQLVFSQTQYQKEDIFSKALLAGTVESQARVNQASLNLIWSM
ncbi:hypothetical protein Lade_0242 [Legionella adelaidensis]|uniref:Outer membrane protein beta-barrel domain-containing protein n=1 Tax=Legionella adelaidensis TaxID=45056 RepID=A0A0W0R3D2_9GAMM|nr:autotransporter domain-containing protein [Legionella adelaidensis]KTC65584.1 hypothetical protein Lade_0242 [Legionella adelaidensis]